MTERLPRRENCLILQHVQKFCLQERRHLANFVEQDRSPVAQFELAGLGVVRSGEGALLVSEQFALQKVGGNGGAIHFQERAMGARRKLVDQASENFLAGAALAQQQHGNIDVRHQRGLRTNLAHLRAGGDEENVVGKLFDFAAVSSAFPDRG